VDDPHQVWLRGFFLIVTGISSLVLYHIWRDVNWGELKWRQESNVVPLFGRDEIRSNQTPLSRRVE
jgi:hypothetical protein